MNSTRMSISLKVAKGSILQTMSLVLNFIVLFFLMPFIIENLGNRLYGLWALIGSLTGYYFALDFGISLAVSRYVAQAIGAKDEKKIPAIVSNAVLLFCILGFLAAIITVVIIIFIPCFVPSDVALISRILVGFVGLEFAITLPLRSYQGVMRAHLDYDFLSFFEVAKLFSRSVLIIIFLLNGFGIIALGIINFSMNTFQYLASFIYVKKKYHVPFDKNELSKKKIKELLNYSKYVFLAQVADTLRFRIAGFIVAGYLGLTYVAIYSIAEKIVSQFVNLMTRMTGVMTPLFSQYEGDDDYASIREMYLLGVRGSLMVSFFIGGNILILGKSFIFTWIGPSYFETFNILCILIAGFSIALTQSIGIGVLQSINKHQYTAYQNIGEGVLNLILTLILVKPFGVLGVASGTAIPMVISKIFVQPYVVCLNIRLSKRVLLSKVLGPVLCILVFFTLTNYIIKHLMFENYLSYFEMVYVIAFEAIIYLIVMYLLVLEKKEKEFILKVFKKITG